MVRITSRIKPAVMSSGVSVRSSATLSPEWLATDQPSLGVSVITRSSGVISALLSSYAIVYEPTLRRSRTSEAASDAAMAAAIACTSAPYRAPIERKFALIEMLTSPSLSSERRSNFATLSSS